MTNLLLIESPGKLKKLSKILGSNWLVKASMGHVRELANDGEDALGFEMVGDQIDCRYIPRDPRSKKVLAELRQAVKQADTVYIATDPDREGETIGWHLQQALRLKQPRRVVYSEITDAAVRQAIAQPRTLDQDLIAAGRARDCLDKLVGYKGSRHVVWPLNNGAKSLGRVQSATLHLLCLREHEIQNFKPQDYWSVWVAYQEGFKAFYCKNWQRNQAKSEEPHDAGDDKKQGTESDRVTTQAEADRLLAIARSNPHKVVQVEGKLKHQSPPPPFVTSTLQQAAGSRLRFSPEKTMQVAQKLYEAGLITYMRTDSIALAEQFQTAVRGYLQQNDPNNVPKKTTKHRGLKGAQEAHEAIRPTDVNAVPQQITGSRSNDEAALYTLIWNRAIAALCAPARLRKTRIITQSGEIFWEARGQVLEFAGYTLYWHNLSADSQLPTVQDGQSVTLQKAQADQKQTQPPPRYTEPKLVQLMERQGIGRPSTYAPTIKTLRTREYVTLTKGKLQPTALGLELDSALEELLPDLIQAEFTAQMEASLDAIAHGQQEWQTYLTHWHRTYFDPALHQACEKIAEGSLKTTIHPTSGGKQSSAKAQVSEIACPKCEASMQKIPSRSKKLKADHFLKCATPDCDTVMFWNMTRKAYELPYAQRATEPQSITEHLCPVCSAYLGRYNYQKEGKDKVMLRCSVPENRRKKCKEVAYFQTKHGGFWSPKFGNLKEG